MLRLVPITCDSGGPVKPNRLAHAPRLEYQGRRLCHKRIGCWDRCGLLELRSPAAAQSCG